MSTLKADALTTKSDNTDLTITGGGTGVPNLETGYKVNGTVEKLTGIAPGSSGNLLTSDGTDWTSAAAGGGGPSQATQAAIEAETNEDTYAPPDLIKHNPGVVKAWAKWDNAGTLAASLNVSSVTDSGGGDFTVNWDTNFSGSNYCSIAGGNDAGGRVGHIEVPGTPAAGTQDVNFYGMWGISNGNKELKDWTLHYVAALGDQ